MDEEQLREIQLEEERIRELTKVINYSVNLVSYILTISLLIIEYHVICTVKLAEL